MYVESLYPCGDVDTGWKGKDGGWDGRRELPFIISRCKDSKKVDEVNTLKKRVLLDIFMQIKALSLTVN